MGEWGEMGEVGRAKEGEKRIRERERSAERREK
jgi:hypothetical protein